MHCDFGQQTVEYQAFVVEAGVGYDGFRAMARPQI